jgi:hypothetical protein
MKRPDRMPTRLSESLHRQINAYALAASAAGVGVLALTQAAEGKVIYTKTHQVIEGRGDYIIDLNHDGAGDFTLYATANDFSTSFYLKVIPYISGNQIWGAASSASALKAGVRVGRRGPFSSFHRVMVHATASHRFNGPWANGGKGVKNRYLGLKFLVKGEVHYGWARLNVSCHRQGPPIVGTLTGYAYETIPNKPIIAGQEHGKDEATLGRLAQGAPGVLNGGRP